MHPCSEDVGAEVGSVEEPHLFVGAGLDPDALDLPIAFEEIDLIEAILYGQAEALAGHLEIRLVDWLFCLVGFPNAST